MGTNYNGAGYFKFALVSGPMNNAAQATATATVVNGFIVDVDVVQGGFGYNNPPQVTITDPSGTGATVTAEVSGGSVIGYTVQDAGSGYSATSIGYSCSPTKHDYTHDPIGATMGLAPLGMSRKLPSCSR